MADLENAGRGNQLVGPKGNVPQGFTSTPNAATANPDDDPAMAKQFDVDPSARKLTSRNSIKVH